MRKILLIIMFACFQILAGEILSDSTSHGIILLKEKYGTSTIIDSITTVIIDNGNIYITRNKEMYGVYPLENYSITICK